MQTTKHPEWLNQLRDPRYFQILFLSSFLAYGAWHLQWAFELQNYLLLIGTCILIQTVAIYYLKLPWESLRSALITSLSLCLLFKAGEPVYYILAALLAMGSKFLLRYGGKHIFNPSLFGIIVPIILTGETWISPGQWGSAPLLLFFFGGAGLMILFRVSRLETGLTFLVTYALLWYARDVIYLGWDANVTAHKLTNGALLLFSFFMITDPMTIPNNRNVRVIWSIGIALITFIVSSQIYLQTAALWVLFFSMPLVPILDRLFPDVTYTWTENSRSTGQSILPTPKTQQT